MKFAALACVPAVLGCSARAKAPHTPPPAQNSTVPAQPGLPYDASPTLTPAPHPPLAPKPGRPAPWEELFRRNPGLRERLEALKKGHPEVQDWERLFTMPGRPPTVNDLFLQFPELGDFLAPEAPRPEGTPRTRILIPQGKPPVVLALPSAGPAQNPVYRPSDRALFQREHPLLTPDTPVRRSMLNAPEPESPGIVELPVP